MSRFRRRLMGLAALRQAAAPDDFVRVEYIENTSTAYIQTDIIPNAQTGLKTKAYFTDTRDVYFVGLRNGGGNTRWGIGHDDAGFYYCYGNYQGTNRLVDTKGEFYLNYKNDKKFITIDLDDSSTLTSNLPKLSFTPKFGIRIFGAAGSGANTIVKSRIYYLQITQGSEIIRDFIPMYQISTDTYGLWDRVEEKFYTSPNGVKFIGGHQIIYDAEIEYLESNGTQQIDTLYVPKGYDNTIETKITYLGYSNKNSWLSWFSAYVDEKTNTYRIIRQGGLDTQVLVYNGNKASGGGLKIDVTVGTDYDLKLYPSYFLVNGTRYNFTTLRGNENTNTLRLFNNGGTKIRMWGFKLTKGSTVVLDMIPVRVGNVGYMYDKVSNKLFGNNGSGSFILGQDTVVYDKI